MILFRLGAACSLLLGCSSYLVWAQQSPQKPNVPPASQSTPAPQSAPSTAAQPKGTVIFSRSENYDVNAATTGDTSNQVMLSGDALKAALLAEAKPNPIRSAERVTAISLDLRLHPADQAMAARTQVTVRNDGKDALPEIRLDLTSTLRWEEARIVDASGERALKFEQAKIHSDADHTGLLNEIVLPLAEPLAPGASVKLDLLYSGTVPQAADRLTAIGTPDEAALRSDWDRVSEPFTGLRGYGNVAWYPVAARPVFLGEGARLFDSIAAHRGRNAGTKFSLQLTVEFSPGEGDLVGFVNGREIEFTRKDAHSDLEVAGIAHATVAESALGFDEPNIFITQRDLHEAGKLRLWMKSRDEALAKAVSEPWTIAASDVDPMLTNWLGHAPDARLNVLELPEPGDAPFESGALLVTPLEDENQGDGAARLDGLEMVMVHALTHAWLAAGEGDYDARPLWLNEGLAWFMGSLWLEKQHGRDAALRLLEAGRPALALEEPESPGAGDGEPLATAVRPIYTRNKAGYVFWMLRDIAGDGTLSAVLRSELKGDTPSAVEAGFEATLKNAVTDRDISWFVRDWIDTDKGLPDLSIAGVYPSAAATPGSWIVAVDLANAGYVDAEVKLTVRSDSNSETQRVIIPARGKETPKVLITGKPVEVRLNDGSVPETEATVHVKAIE